MLLNLGVTALTRYADVIRRVSLPAFAAFLALFVSGAALAAPDPLPSWNEGPTKAAIEAFVVAATDPSGSKFVAPAARIATFDQDGTLWVEHPVYTEVMYTLDRHSGPGWRPGRQLAAVEPFRTVMSGGSRGDRPAARGRSAQAGRGHPFGHDGGTVPR